jgi:integrase
MLKSKKYFMDKAHMKRGYATSTENTGFPALFHRSRAAVAKQAEVEGVTLHALRHTFGTRLVASGVDLRTVQELMGHADIQTTMIYAHVVEGSKRQAISRQKNYWENCHEITTATVGELKQRQA